MGDVIGDLNSRRAIQGMENVGGAQQITAMVPLSMMFGYATDMRSRRRAAASIRWSPTTTPRCLSRSPKRLPAHAPRRINGFSSKNP